MVQVFIKTYGCQANEADSVHLAKYLQGLGCALVSTEAEADLILINTCAIREKAEQKICSYIGQLAEFKDLKPYLVIGIIGCMASYRKQDLMTRFTHINFAFGAREDLGMLKAQLVDAIELITTQKNIFACRQTEILGTCEPVTKVSALEPKFKRSMINIMRGCNNYCSYCIVPFTTGRERSFAMQDILAQVQADIAGGAREINLLGQNVNSYKDPETGATFAQLLKKVACLDGQFWVRFVSPHPKDMTVDVVDVMAAYPEKLCAFVHFPLQSGSNEILQKMNRTYSVQQYLDQVAMIKQKLPGVMVSTDIIVGFPGEKEEDFESTLRVMEQVRYQMIFSFIYSPRKYTVAAQMQDDCSYRVKLARLTKLQRLHREIGTAINRAEIGKIMRVLVEQKISENLWWARTAGNVRVYLMGQGLEVNQFCFARIDNGGVANLEGCVVQNCVEDAGKILQKCCQQGH